MDNVWFSGINQDSELVYPHPGDWECRTRGPAGTYRKRCQCEPKIVYSRIPFRKLLTERASYSAGHACDEWGNCTLYFSTPFFGVVWRYPTGHRQTDVELPMNSYNSGDERYEWMVRWHEGEDSWREQYPHDG